MHKTYVRIVLKTLSHNIPQVLKYGLMALSPIYFLEQIRSSVVPNICIYSCIICLICLRLYLFKVKPKGIIIPQYVDRR